MTGFWFLMTVGMFVFLLIKHFPAEEPAPFPVPKGAHYIIQLRSLQVGESLLVSEQVVFDSFNRFGVPYPDHLNKFLKGAYGLNLKTEHRARLVKFTKVAE